MAKNRMAPLLDCPPVLGGPDWWNPEPEVCASALVISVQGSSVHLEDAVARLRIGALEHEVRKLWSRVETLQQSVVVPILTFAPAPFEALSPIQAVVQPEAGGYVATFFDANMNASGESQTEAIECLKDVLMAKFRLFSRKEDQLGEEPRRQLSVLRRFMRAV